MGYAKCGLRGGRGGGVVEDGIGTFIGVILLSSGTALLLALSGVHGCFDLTAGKRG